MPENEDSYESLMSVNNLESFTNEEALGHISHLTDLSSDLRKIEGLQHSLKLSEEIQKKDLNSEQRALSHYFMANAYADIQMLTRKGTEKSWDWEQEEIEKEVFHLRTALKTGSQSLPKERLCQMLTNLGNVMSNIGRFVEAVEYWDRALEKVPSFPMAIGNRGFGFFHYAGSLYDLGHAAVFLKRAHNDLDKALLSKEIHAEAKEGFNKHRTLIDSALSKMGINKDFDLDSFSLGDSEQEVQYRRWCLENRLFLNPLNDLGAFPIGAQDILSTPSIVVGIYEGPYYPGYFNQMKQEFVSARYLFYEAIRAEQAHFSDKEVLLFNTLDYPSYSLAVEKMKASFRTAYSLFDKAAYFLNHYLRLSIPEKQVSFRTFWYESQSKKNGLRKDYKQRQNWPLRGLFWLSKDLYEDKQGFMESMEPEAQQLNEIRNHLEHKYLKIHEDLWRGHPPQDDKILRGLADTLAFSVYRSDFQEKTLRLMKMARAALIYLSLAIHSEEKRRAKERKPGAIVPGIPLDVWEDKWKV
jgi:tetratricopeptide (TPR) repeat protein